MIEKVYALTTRTEQDCDQGTVSAPITGIRPGDVVVTGHGTFVWCHREVVSVKDNFNDYGHFIVVTCADGYSFADAPGGFWYQVIKADPEQQRLAGEAAAAFARAWDRKR